MLYEFDWEIDPKDFPHKGSGVDKLSFIAVFGAMAPSIHNTQPWQFKISDSEIVVSIARERLLQDGDPTGRETWVSLGCCIENLILAGEYFGLPLEIHKSSYGLSDGYIGLKISGDTTTQQNWDVISAIKSRVTDRSIYSDRTIDAELINKIKTSYSSRNTEIRVESDRGTIQEVAALTSRGILLALGLPGFRSELSGLIRTNGHHMTGIPTHALELGLGRSFLEPLFVRHGVNTSQQANKERKSMLSAAAVVLILTKGDSAKYWVEAGMAYEKAALVATDLGLSTATTAAITEAADFHEDIEKKIETGLRLQVVMRIGYGKKKRRHTRRLAMRSLLT